MPDGGTIAVIGATGMLGRPVARQLIGGGFAVRAVTRDAARARGVVPDGCEVVQADTLDEGSVARALDGCAAVYVNLSTPRSHRRQFNAELACTPVIVEAARRVGSPRLLKISGLGVPEAAGDWWAAAQKIQADEAVIRSGLSYTIFRPTWFMESLELFRVGPLLVGVTTPPDPLYWLAGDDYGRQVAAALRSNETRGRIFLHQGPEGVSFAEALRRFARAQPRRTRVVRLPLALLRAMAPLSPPSRYLVDLLAMTFPGIAQHPPGLGHAELGVPRMTIEDHVAAARRRNA